MNEIFKQVRRTCFEMRCRKCGYHYYVLLLKLHGIETCPMCGNREDFFNFVIPAGETAEVKKEE